jgi:hypothetical protein
MAPLPSPYKEKMERPDFFSSSDFPFAVLPF